MATFEAKVYRLEIEEHPNADAIELAKVGDYRSIVRKGDFKTGDLGVYIPEAAIVPDWLISELGLEGKLAGKDKNRVKAIKLRGILSQGLIYPVQLDLGPDYDHYIRNPEKTSAALYKEVEEGTDVTEYLDITKYEPPIPVHMAGEVSNAFGYTLKYDIENFKRHPDVLFEGEEVVMTEKLHGTWCCFGFHPEIDHPIVTSRGLSEKGLIFKMNDANEHNLYVRALMSTANENGDDIITRIRSVHLELLDKEPAPFYILGEIFGHGVQDLTYGLNDVQFRVFDIYQGEPEQGKYKDYHTLKKFCANYELKWYLNFMLDHSLKK